MKEEALSPATSRWFEFLARHLDKDVLQPVGSEDWMRGGGLLDCEIISSIEITSSVQKISLTEKYRGQGTARLNLEAHLYCRGQAEEQGDEEVLSGSSKTD